MALAVNTPRNLVDDVSLLGFPVANTVTAYAGGLQALWMPGGTAPGFAVPWTAAAFKVPVGFHRPLRVNGSVAGDGTLVNANRSNIWGASQFIVDLAVTGLAGTGADNGQLVYATADGTFTLTPPASLALPVGVVVKEQTATICTVQFFSFVENLLQGLSGGQIHTVPLGSLDCDTITTANQRTGMPLRGHGKIIAFYAMVDVACAGGGGTADLNLEIATVNVTGGVLTISTAAGGTKGTKLTATAITAANEFHDGDALDIEATLGTDMTAGRVDMFIDVQWLPGL